SGDRLSLKDAFDFERRTAAFLSGELGIGRGDPVIICTDNNADLPLVVFGVIRTGAVAIPLNHMMKEEEIAYIARDSGATTIIVDRSVFERHIRSRSAIPGIKNWVHAGPVRDLMPGFISLDEGTAAAQPLFSPANMDQADVSAIFYTSGTTGHPKGSQLASRNLFHQRFMSAIIPIRGDEFAIFALPFAHIMGFTSMVVGLFLGINRGCYLKHFDAAKVLGVIEKHRGTIFVGVPSMFAMLLESHPERYDLSSMRVWVNGADAIPAAHAEAISRLGHFLSFGPLRSRALFIEAYGMVELSGIATFNALVPGFSFQPGCVGWPVPPLRIRIVDEEGKPVRWGGVGEIAVRGPGVTQGYWRDPVKTGESFTADGWFKTGDFGKIDLIGRIHFADRKKDVIKCGGYSIFSREIEHRLARHPAVAQAVVFGIPHKTKTEVPVALVILKEGREATSGELLAWAKERLSDYKAPRDIRIVKREELPLGPTGKVLKKVLRDEWAARFAIT
ncbi:MAG: AMP-binding protein, partial [Myxococcota bacterium]